MNDELDSLHYDRLTYIFAVEVAGFERGWSGTGMSTGPEGDGWRSKENGEWRFFYDHELPSYATNESAVIPFAQRLKKFHIYWDDFKMIIAEPTPSYHIDFAGRCWVRNAPTLARALCIALIRHARVSRGHNKSRS